MHTQTSEYLIIGQGIAGTLFAHELERHGHSFVVIDAHEHNASKTAAGMYNPVVLKRFSPVWQAREQIATALKTFSELEHKLDIVADYPFDIMRVFHNDAEKDTWTKKAHSHDLQGLLDTQWYESINAHIRAPYGLGRVASSGKIDLKTVLETYRNYLHDSHVMYTEAVDYQRLHYQDGVWLYKGERATIAAPKVICCEGYGVKSNPYFKELPLNGNKGEVLIVKAPHVNLDAAIKSKVFIMPMPERGNDIYFVGASYNWTDKDSIPTQAARDEMMAKLAQFVDGDITVLSQHAGIRPTVADRRPLLGEHKSKPNLYILNGLGTRGVMLGATMAKHLYALAQHNQALPAEVDIARFDDAS